MIQTLAWKVQKCVAAADWVHGLLQPSGRDWVIFLVPVYNMEKEGGKGGKKERERKTIKDLERFFK